MCIVYIKKEDFPGGDDLITQALKSRERPPTGSKRDAFKGEAENSRHEKNSGHKDWRGAFN